MCARLGTSAVTDRSFTPAWQLPGEEKDAKPIPQENQLQGKGLVKPWVLSSHGLPDGKDLAQGVKLKDSLMRDLEHAKVPP